MSQTSYAAAGVDIDAQDRTIDLIRAACRSTYTPRVVTDVGAFGGLFALEPDRWREPVLVSSIDGLGTKGKIAVACGRFDTVGRDLVNHCVNDIAVMGAEPLFFLDYFGTGRLEPPVAAAVVEGLAAACREAGCALIGGELAEMPGVYHPGDFDLVGCIVGVVERGEAITGASVSAGDVVLGLPSTGLHTNGYSLARKIIADAGLDLSADPGGLGQTLGEALLEVHRSYLANLRALRRAGLLKAAAHVTGGGLLDNLPRVLPAGLGAVLERGSWPEPPLFGLLQRLGQVADEELYRTFNMGLGMLLVVAPDAVDEARRVAGADALVVGRVVAGAGIQVRGAGRR